MAEPKNGDIHQYLTFTIADAFYAVKVTHIREVLTVPRITKVPRMPDFMTGIINLRGKVVPIIDLAKKFGLGETAVTEDTSIIVAEIAENAVRKLTLGLFSDSVQKVITIEPKDIEGPPKIGIPIDTAFIQGVGQINGNFIIILNIDEIFTGKELRDIEAESATT